MEEALALSRQALPDCRSNPPVGCVLVWENAVLARGFTQAPGQDHAEAAALRQAGILPAGTIAYVTLEPCSFVGRTPSCARSLIDAGVSGVVASLLDPDPRNSGAGIEMLRAAGIRVEVGLLQDRVAAFLDPYLIRP